jgi:hypothetical protein
MSKTQKIYALLLNDKVQHFVYGICLSSIAYPFGIGWALILPLIIGLVKEYVDTKGFGQGSRADVIATFGGGAFLMGWYALVEKIQSML